MVKGRRVRDVVSCPRNEACVAPNRKRGKIALISPHKGNGGIAAYFQSVDIEIKQEKPRHDDFIITLMEKNEVDLKDILPSTPLKSCNYSNPLTPHRIELSDDIKLEPKKENEKLKTKRSKVTDYFPVRRSIRKTKTTVQEEKLRSMQQTLRCGVEEGLEIKHFSDKGRGVVTSRPFFKGDFVVEYSGDLIDLNEAKRRELKYAQDLNTGCYMYYFKHNDQQYCVDATIESGRFGRLVNHSRNGNLLTRTVFVDNKPRLVLIAKDDIKVGAEVTYDYGDRSKESLRYHPWLAY